MIDYPLENQVCTLEQAKELAELLGDDAPGSLWVCVQFVSHAHNSAKGKWKRIIKQDLILVSDFKDEHAEKSWIEIVGFYPAYTGDELGALLDNVTTADDIPIHAYDRADTAIQGLKEGWIKKQDFKYPSVN